MNSIGSDIPRKSGDYDQEIAQWVALHLQPNRVINCSRGALLGSKTYAVPESSPSPKGFLVRLRRRIQIQIASISAVGIVLIALPGLVCAETVGVFFNATGDDQINFAAKEVVAALKAKSHTVELKTLSELNTSYSNKKVVIALSSDSAAISMLAAQGGTVIGKLSEQAYALRTTTQGQASYWALGGDRDGAMYGGLSIAENINNHGFSKNISLEESPYILSRGVKANLPLDKRSPTYFGPGDGNGFGGDAARKAIIHVWDINYWREWFDEMARSRYNVLTIWNCHPFAALGLPMAESFTDIQLYDDSIIAMTLAQKVAFWKEVMAYGKGRGFQIYFVNWNIYTYGTSHTDSKTDEGTKDYTRKAVRLMFETYPDLAGLGVSAGENMRGMDTSAKVKWLAATFGKGIEDYAKIHPERKITFLNRFLDVSASTVKSEFHSMLACPNVNLDMTYKYSVAHLYSTPDPQWIEIKDGENSIADLDAAGLKTWLELRNEDFFFLSWGDPQFVRDCIAGFPDKNKYISGFMYGSDGWVYTKDFTSKSAPFKDMLEIKRDWFLYRLWGRLSYNPQTPNQVFINEMASRYPGVDVQALFDAWTGASRGVPLAAELVMGSRTADASEGHFWWDWQWYPELCQSVGGFKDIDDFIQAKPAEGSTMCSIESSASGKCPVASRTSYSVADTIEIAATNALQKISSLDTKEFTDLALYKKNIKAQSYISLYYAEKIRGATYKSANNTASARTAMGNAYCHWINYTTLMNELHTGADMERTRDFRNWSGNIDNVLEEYSALGGSGVPSYTLPGTAPTVKLSDDKSVATLTGWISGTTNPKVSGNNRLMTVMVMGESSDDFSATGVTYGGQAMTKQTERLHTDGSCTYAAIFTLSEAGINNASSGTIAVSWSATPTSGSSICSVLLGNVDQTKPISLAANNALTGTRVSTTSALPTGSGDMVIMSGATANNKTIAFANDFTKQFESDSTWGDGTGGDKIGSGASETPSFSQSASGRMVVCAIVATKAGGVTPSLRDR